MSRTWCLPLLLTLACVQYRGAQRGNSVCQTTHYRTLPTELQNEHQCLILERLQEDLNEHRMYTEKMYDDLYSLMTKFSADMYRTMHALKPTAPGSSKAMPSLNGIPLVRDCNELLQNGITGSGVYPVRLPNRNIVNVWCDMDTEHGGWTLIQRRTDGSVNFSRPWDDYTFGFGNPNTEYWLGNDNLYHLTNFKNYSVRFDLWDWEDNHAYALYDQFRLDGEKEGYQIKITDYSGTAGDAMRYHNNMKFSTIDTDNDKWYLSCAKKDQAGWWYKSCGFASLNGLYVENGTIDIAPDGLIRGIIWYNWKNNYGYSMKRTEIKVKPLTSLNIERDLEKLKEQERLDKERALKSILQLVNSGTAADTTASRSTTTSTTSPVAAETSTKPSTRKIKRTTVDPDISRLYDYDDYDQYFDGD